MRKDNIIALVGASNNPDKYGHRIFKDLTDFGYRIIPINLKETSVLGKKAYAHLKDVPEKIDVVNFVIPPAQALKVLKECLELNLKDVWFQPGASDDSVLAFCERNEFTYVHDVCMMVEKFNISESL